MTESRPIAEGSQPLATTSTPRPAPAGASSAPGLGTALPILLVVGALAGAAGSEVIQRTEDLFHVAPERLGIPPYPPDVERDRLLCAIANHAIGFGGLGLLLGGGLGLGLGLLRGSPGGALRCLLVGGALGLLLGAMGGIAAFFTYEALVPVPLDGIFKAILIHLPNWLLLAIAIAVAAALVRQPGTRVGQLFASALVAGFVAAMLYPVLALFLFPAANADRPIPFGLGLRVFCFALGGAVLGVAAARWMRTPSPAAAST